MLQNMFLVGLKPLTLLLQFSGLNDTVITLLSQRSIMT